jgi:tyrosyl-tRNA synthetase
MEEPSSEAVPGEAATRPPAEAVAAHLIRNAVDCLPQGALAERIAEGRPLRVKLGLDPTAPDIHLGHTVVLTKLREFQDAGHTVVLIVGDYTARVGDPSGRSVARPVLSAEQIDANAETYRRQAAKILLTDERLEVRRNAEWLDMSIEDLFRLVRHPTVAQLLERDDFAKRWAAAEPISLLELLYPVLQGYDSVCVRADVELGGTDQTFNLLMGRSIQQAYGQPPQVVLTMPLLTGVDGAQKMSKSFGNQIGVTDPPGEMYGKTLRIPDEQIAPWFSLLLGDQPPAGAGPRDAKRALARALVTRFHGEAAAAEAEAGFDRVFIAHEFPEEVEEAVVQAQNGTVHLPAAIAEVFGRSRSEARRTLAQGGVRLDGQALAPDALDLPAAELDGRVLQLGKRHFRRLKIV